MPPYATAPAAYAATKQVVALDVAAAFRSKQKAVEAVARAREAFHAAERDAAAAVRQAPGPVPPAIREALAATVVARWDAEGEELRCDAALRAAFARYEAARPTPGSDLPGVVASLVSLLGAPQSAPPTSDRTSWTRQRGEWSVVVVAYECTRGLCVRATLQGGAGPQSTGDMLVRTPDDRVRDAARGAGSISPPFAGARVRSLPSCTATPVQALAAVREMLSDFEAASREPEPEGAV